jgi:hypothetical protein
MKKILTVILFAMATALPASAQQMLIEKTGSENEIISLDNLKQITFDGTTVNIEQTDGKTSSTSMEYIDRISFGNFTSIDDVESDGALVDYVSRDIISVECVTGTEIAIYSVTGMRLLDISSEAGRRQISIANLPKGIYILKIGDKTAKIAKR